MALLEVRGLQKWYGRRQVVNGVSFDVSRGEVVGLLGPNGAGKTTSFRMTIGLITADGGTVIFDGREINHLAMYQRARAGMGYLAQDSSVFKLLSVEDNLMAILETREMSRRQRKDRQNELLDQFGLTKIRKTKANRVSGGERRRLEIARSLITEPKLIMLDEPFAGIDPKTVAEIQDQIRSLVETYNIGILLTDHNIRETLEVTDRSYVIREGQVFAYGDRLAILNNPDVRRHYIGDRFDVGHLQDKRHVHSLPDAQGEPSRQLPDDVRHALAHYSLGTTPGESSSIGTDDVADPLGSESHPTSKSAPPGPNAAPTTSLDVALDALTRDPGEVPVPDTNEMTPRHSRVEPADDFERSFGSTITVLGDVVVEKVEFEVLPPTNAVNPPPPGHGRSED
jgi:lipopolysaccharide export system ATP-binding protein